MCGRYSVYVKKYIYILMTMNHLWVKLVNKTVELNRSLNGELIRLNSSLAVWTEGALVCYIMCCFIRIFTIVYFVQYRGGVLFWHHILLFDVISKPRLWVKHKPQTNVEMNESHENRTTLIHYRECHMTQEYEGKSRSSATVPAV